MPRTLPFVLLLPITPLLAQVPRTEVPVRTVMLFSSGVGYFEHAGNVQGNGTTELRFKTAQINDILKSLVLQDLDGGRVSTINYPSQDPVAKTLRSFQVDITANPSLAALVNQLRGAKVSVQVAGEQISGTILGVESRARMSERGESVEVQVLNLITGAMIRAVELPAVTALTLDDPTLQEELTKALAVLSTARDQDKKPVTISFSGNGSRRVRVGYVVETPVWKTSYRLLMGDKVTTLQGWAIVENQTESDWNDVALSLVSGRPISFIMDLYQPLYLTRPTVVPELFASLRPRAYEGGTTTDMARTAMAPTTGLGVAGGVAGGAGGRGGAGAGRGGVGGAAAGAFETADLSVSAAETVRSAATSGALGELFQYTIANVTLPRQTSAMLPIVTDSVSVERLSIYNAAVLSSNPLNGVRLRNVTGKHLLQGPVTVLDQGGYAGDAQIDNIPPGQSRLLAYGIDLDMTVTSSTVSHPTAVTAAKVAKGVLVLSRRFVTAMDYEVTNKGARDRTILIEHPIRADWKLVDTAKPVETTSTLYRFQGNALTGKVTTLTVKEEIVREEAMAMLQADVGALLTYSKTGEITRDVREAIARAVQLRQGVLDTERGIAAKTAQITEIAQEQDRIRENMKTVGETTEYYQRLLSKLNEQESLIEKTQSERDALYRKLNGQRTELESYLSDLTIG